MSHLLVAYINKNKLSNRVTTKMDQRPQQNADVVKNTARKCKYIEAKLAREREREREREN